LNLYTLVIIVLILILLVLGLYVIPRWRIKRAVRQVIGIFRQHNALDKKTAKTIDELGLRPRGYIESMLHTRDFKPHALDGLIRLGIVKSTEGGRLYLVEDALMASGVDKSIHTR
jgi:hypothetical protein